MRFIRLFLQHVITLLNIFTIPARISSPAAQVMIGMIGGQVSLHPDPSKGFRVLADVITYAEKSCLRAMGRQLIKHKVRRARHRTIIEGEMNDG